MSGSQLSPRGARFPPATLGPHPLLEFPVLLYVALGAWGFLGFGAEEVLLRQSSTPSPKWGLV